MGSIKNNAFKVETWPLERIKPYPKNARKIPQKAIDKVAASLKEFGWQQPIVIDRKGVIVVGHTRHLAAQQLGWTEAPVRIFTGTPAQARAYRIMDNRSHEEASWDAGLLAFELGELKGLDLDLSLTGFDPREIGKMLPESHDEPEAQMDRAEELQAKWKVERGQVWEIGAHRLMCGDSTDIKDCADLMQEQCADLVFTDPPYGVDYDGGTTVREKLQGDTSTELYEPACKMAAFLSREKAALYLWHAGVKGIAAAAAAAAAGYVIRCEIVWNKNLAQFGSLSSQYKQKHEPAYYCHKKGHAPKWYGPTNEVTVWDCERASANEHHPTQKPPQLAKRAIANSCEPGELVLDLFLGGGSTMVAAESLNRRCYGMEIEPKYCAVILERMTAMGLTPKLATAVAHA